MLLSVGCYFRWIWLDAQSYNFCNVTIIVNLTIVKLFVNAIKQSLSSGEYSECEFNHN